jgi:hypothetical protein
LNVSENAALLSLRCDYNQLDALDLLKNAALQGLRCGYNQLDTLDLSKNTNLHQLECQGNQLTKLDISNNIELAILRCSNNRLATLDLRQNAKLYSLDCRSNKLTVLDVTKSLGLEQMYCSDNQLTVLNILNNTKLWELDCRENYMLSPNSVLGWQSGWLILGQTFDFYPQKDFDEIIVTISTQPAAKTIVTEGSITGSLAVTASVTPEVALNYQWYRMSNIYTPIFGATDAAFMIPTDLTVGAYYYFCSVSATGGNSVTSNIATVTVTPPSPEHNYRVYLSSAATSLNIGETLYVDVMLAGNINYTQIAAEVAYDTGLLELTGYHELRGWAASVTRSAAGKVAVRSIPSMNMVVGTACSDDIMIARLEFMVNKGFAGESVETEISIAAASVSPPGGVVGATVGTGQAVDFTVTK